jgi:chemotaxis signal transduction protein
MQGVVMVRGSLIPVYSPHQTLGLPPALGEAVLIFGRGLAGRRVGVLIDDVEDTISLDLRELRRTPDAEENEGVVLGVLRHANAIVAIVDAIALIAACQMAALQEIA